MTEPFKIDLTALRTRQKDVSPVSIEKADIAGEQHGFLAREPQRRRGPQAPEPAKFMPRSCRMSPTRSPTRPSGGEFSKAC